MTFRPKGFLSQVGVTFRPTFFFVSSRCDLQAKVSALSDTLLIVQRDIEAERHQTATSIDELAHGTLYQAVISEDFMCEIEVQSEAEAREPHFFQPSHRPSKCRKAFFPRIIVLFKNASFLT